MTADGNNNGTSLDGNVGLHDSRAILKDEVVAGLQDYYTTMPFDNLNKLIRTNPTHLDIMHDVLGDQTFLMIIRQINKMEVA